MLEVKSIAKHYKQRQVVKAVSLPINCGEVVGLLGPNGAGKTTSFYIIVGLIQPDSGQIFLDQHDITTYPMHARARLGLGYLPQEASIFRKLTVAENILAILELRKDLDTKTRYQKLDDLLQEFQITHLRDVLGISLSGGERRR